MAKKDGITLDGEPFEMGEDNEEVESEDQESSLDEKAPTTESKTRRKEELEAELAGLDLEAQSDAEEIAEEIAEEEPEKGQVARESREAAKDIAGEYKLSKEAEDKLASAITQKVLESLQGQSTEKKPRPRTPDKRPKPTHFSERTIFSRRRDR